jgi:hypothetical protein
MVARRPLRVFLSHARHDRWIARRMADAVRSRATEARARIEILLDERSIEITQDIEDVLRRAIEDCDELIVLLTRQSIQSSWVLVEIGAAWGFEKPMAGVVYDLDVDKLPDVVRAKRIVELADFDDYVEQVVRRAALTRKR